MAYLNQQERDDLYDELKDLSFFWAKFRLNNKDPKGKLTLYRNNQYVDQYITQWNLYGLGTRVKIIERNHEVLNERTGIIKSTYEIEKIIVEALPENKT